jgi:Protein of unknown function (DUF3433)
VASASLLLAILCIVIATKSRQNDGLVNVPASSSFVFNFLPTLVAVVYTLSWASISQDVIRTEPWALLSRPGGAKASESILMENEASWNHIVQAIAHWKKRGIRWAVLLAIAGNTIGSLVLNPLSAGLLQVVETAMTSHQQFLTADVSQFANTSIDDLVFAKAAADALYNISTSAWIGRDYFVVPFWPAGESPNLGRQLSSSPQTWQGNANVFKVQVQCEDLPNHVVYFPFNSYTSAGLAVNASDACSTVLEIPDLTGGQWAQLNVRSHLNLTAIQRN